MQTRDFRMWGGCRSTHGILKGKVYYEVECSDEGNISTHNLIEGDGIVFPARLYANTKTSTI